jgi:hypothetical protein
MGVRSRRLRTLTAVGTSSITASWTKPPCRRRARAPARGADAEADVTVRGLAEPARRDVAHAAAARRRDVRGDRRGAAARGRVAGPPLVTGLSLRPECVAADVVLDGLVAPLGPVLRCRRARELLLWSFLLCPSRQEDQQPYKQTGTQIESEHRPTIARLDHPQPNCRTIAHYPARALRLGGVARSEDRPDSHL